MKKLLFAIALGVMSLSQTALASDYGCKVLLCLSNPSGPTAVSQCVPPINQLWDDLRHGRAFPTCDEAGAAGSGNHAGNTWASNSYCAQSLVQLDPMNPTDPSSASCNAQGGIDVMVNGTLTTRVWWGVGGSGATYETAAAGTVNYDPSQSVTNAIASYCAANPGAGGCPGGWGGSGP